MEFPNVNCLKICLVFFCILLDPIVRLFVVVVGGGGGIFALKAKLVHYTIVRGACLSLPWTANAV